MIAHAIRQGSGILGNGSFAAAANNDARLRGIDQQLIRNGRAVMRVLIATDAWHPQVNGVVRTLTSLAQTVRNLGVTIDFLTAEGMRSFPLPTYSSVRLALPNRREIARRIEEARPNAIHVATEGSIGFMTRSYCLRHGLRFTTSYTTRFPEYIRARFGVPASWTYAVLRRFHAAASLTMVSTPSLKAELSRLGFKGLAMWTRGVDTDVFKPEPAIDLGLPRPIFLSVGRIAVEKNLEGFLSLDLPGSKVVIGGGPQEQELRQRFPEVTFLGLQEGATLAAQMAAADVFVFPSRTDTFGVVQLEALACGVPVAAFPVTGPKDVIGHHPVGVLDHDLRSACLAALRISRKACRDFALRHSWNRSALQFIGHIQNALLAGSCEPHVDMGIGALAAPR
jgi:1,2-diacylglycerol 3-alpha-glucosyltransferase/glucuronosyltransferase